MTTPYDTIKTRLETILQSKRTTDFLDGLTNFGFSLSNSPQITNKFIDKVFQGEGIKIVNKHRRKNLVNNVIIDDKKILIKTNSISNNLISFKTLKYERQDQIVFSNLKERINNDLDNFDYIFLIKIEEEYDEEFDELKTHYHYYLFSSKYFKITENSPLFVNRASISGDRWIFKGYREFCFKYDIESLISFNICPPYISK